MLKTLLENKDEVRKYIENFENMIYKKTMMKVF